MLQYPGFDPLNLSLDEVIDQITPLQFDIQENWQELGRLFIALRNISGRDGTFSRILRQMGIHMSTANYLMNLIRKFDGLEVEPPRDIPWRHLVEIGPYLNLVDMAWMFSYCRTHTREELIDLIRIG